MHLSVVHRVSTVSILNYTHSGSDLRRPTFQAMPAPDNAFDHSLSAFFHLGGSCRVDPQACLQGRLVGLSRNCLPPSLPFLPHSLHSLIRSLTQPLSHSPSHPLLLAVFLSPLALQMQTYIYLYSICICITMPLARSLARALSLPLSPSLSLSLSLFPSLPRHSLHGWTYISRRMRLHRSIPICIDMFICDAKYMHPGTILQWMSINGVRECGVSVASTDCWTFATTT